MPYTMPPEMVYREKGDFVKKLEEACLMIDYVRGIEYRVLEGKDDGLNLELVRIDWHGPGDQHDYINVTINSLEAILREVTLVVSESRAYGQINDTKTFDEYWKEAKSYES